MQSPSLQPTAKAWPLRLVTFFLAAVAAASATFWILRWPLPATATHTAAPPIAEPGINSTRLAQLLGAGVGKDSTIPLATSTQYQLLGVIAQGGHRGSALIGIDGQPPKPYRVGERLSDQVMLQSVNARSVVLASDLNAADGIALELPRLPGTP